MSRLAIDTDYLAHRLEHLLATPSPTGYTDTIVRETYAELERLGLSPALTRRGALRAVLEGEDRRPARAIVSHLDTLGAQVKRLKENGRLELVPIGTWSARFAEGARVTVFTEHGYLRGTILPLKASGHIFDSEVDQLPVGWSHVELRIDARASSVADLVRIGVEVGDTVAVDPQPEFLPNGYIVSRHLDDKAGAALMLASLKALVADGRRPPVDVHFIFTIAEEVGVGASSALPEEVAAVVAVDNGTVGPGQNSSEFGVTLAMADQTGPFDYHLTRALARICREEDIRCQRDVFRYYRSDAAAALVAGHDVRNALVTFGVDASHGYERTHMHALRSVAELVTAFALSPVEYPRDAKDTAHGIYGFPHQPMPEEMAEGPAEPTREDEGDPPAGERS